MRIFQIYLFRLPSDTCSWQVKNLNTSLICLIFSVESWQRMIYGSKDYGFSESPYIKIFDNDKDLAKAVYREISKTRTMIICVPSSILTKLCAACVSNLLQTNRIIVYFRTEADLKQNRSEHIDHKVQCCLKHNLKQFLDGAEIRSILYKEGPIDPLALINKLKELEQRFLNKEKAAEAVKMLVKVYAHSYYVLF
jgi:hypothetical protein